MDKEKIREEVAQAAQSVWAEQKGEILKALGVTHISRDDVVEGLLSSDEVALKLAAEVAADYRKMARLIKRALLTLAFPNEMLSSR